MSRSCLFVPLPKLSSFDLIVEIEVSHKIEVLTEFKKEQKTVLALKNVIGNANLICHIFTVAENDYF